MWLCQVFHCKASSHDQVVLTLILITSYFFLSDRFVLGRSGLAFVSHCGAAGWFLLLASEFRSWADTFASVPSMELRFRYTWLIRKHHVSVTFFYLLFHFSLSCSIPHLIFYFYKWATLVFQVLSNIHTVRATYNSKSPKTWSFSPKVCLQRICFPSFPAFSWTTRWVQTSNLNHII